MRGVSAIWNLAFGCIWNHLEHGISFGTWHNISFGYDLAIWNMTIWNLPRVISCHLQEGRWGFSG